jgi:hypothetical protein
MVRPLRLGPPGDHGQYGWMREAAETLRSIRSAWDSASRDGGQACGTDVAARAYTAMQAAWFDELGVYLELRESDGQ